MNLRKSSKNEELGSSRKSSLEFKNIGLNKTSFKFLNSIQVKANFQGQTDNICLNERSVLFFFK